MEVTAIVKQGKLRGCLAESVKGDKFVQFLGIPYGKPPVGNLRFKAPQPADGWTGERDATKESTPSLQYDNIQQKFTGSEDSLYLNVFTKNVPNNKPSNLKPVMVWIHGGAFILGSNSTDVYGPEVFMTKDIVLVSINYRLGLIGFLSLEDTSLGVPGNAGLKDQVLALKWVQDNIENFGGDPKNLTIFGESAGGSSVHLLVLSPTAKGLFHRAIAMSGSAYNPWVWGTRNAIEVAKHLGNEVKNEKEALKVLMEASASSLSEAQTKFTDMLLNAATVRPFGPVVEHPNPTAFLSRDPRDVIATGEYNKVPFMTGFVSREGLLLDGLSPSLGGGKDVMGKNLVPFELGYQVGSDKAKKLALEIEEFYKRYGDMSIYEACTDVFFANGVLDTVEQQIKNSSHPIFLYKISVETKLAFLKCLLKINKPGVAHADEMGLLFHVKQIEETCSLGSIEDKSRERLLTLFINFAKYGNPTPLEAELGINWTPVSDPGNMSYLDVGEELTLKCGPFAERRAFWKTVYLNHKFNL